MAKMLIPLDPKLASLTRVSNIFMVLSSCRWGEIILLARLPNEICTGKDNFGMKLLLEWHIVCQDDQ
jgi:hypothetical protein